MKTSDNIDTYLKGIWDNAVETPVERTDLKALHSAMGVADKTEGRKPGRWVFAALALAAAVAIGEFALLVKPGAPEETVSLVTAAASKGDFLLPDGSHVWLNSDSRLSYRTSSPRAVTLKGEAFFDIAKDGTPFTVKTEDLGIKVLGTRFNIRSNANFGRDEVSLLSGRVEVSAKGATQVLQPGEKAGLKDGTLTKRSADVTIDSCWTGGELVFQNTTMNDILESLEHWYCVNFQPAIDVDLSQRLSFKIRKESPKEAIIILRRLTGCRFKILDDNNILITK